MKNQHLGMKADEKNLLGDDTTEKTSEPAPYILLADDDADDCQFFKIALHELWPLAKLALVHDGNELLQLLHRKGKLPDMLFLDLDMPGMNGFFCLTEIRLYPKTALLPITILSTSFHPGTIDLVMEKGAQYYIQKPKNVPKLKESISRLLTPIVAALPPLHKKPSLNILKKLRF